MRSFKNIVLAVAATSAIGLAACDIDQVREGRMPDVEVDVEEGALPQYDVDVADVEVGSDADTVIVRHPTVDVEMPDEDEDGNRPNRN